ncbi:hypothetical protein AB832_01500 [Flavobacteriaceae bacterium (ex Bugula neritina AB1)]|nr:hypothetical protein AB832_01500 [Flavobacteriaceae bacterium (ex Bugula neritina AB1)]
MPEIVTGRVKTLHSGTQNMISTKIRDGLFELEDIQKNISTRFFSSRASSETSGFLDWWEYAGNRRTVLDAHWGAGAIYDYFLEEHNYIGRNNNANNPDEFDIIVSEPGPINISSISGFYDTDSNSIVLGWLATTLDIISHEYAHALTRFIANLSSSGDSPSLNEGISDIFGAVIENYYFPNRENWLLSEQSIPNGIRDLSNPNNSNTITGSQPDTYRGDFWQEISESPHHNSTVISHWFYLLSEGGRGTNDNGVQYNVSGIGIEKAVKIVFRALNVYMTPNTSFENFSDYTIQAANDLFRSEPTQVWNAWVAVGLPTDRSARCFDVNANDVFNFPYTQNFENGLQGWTLPNEINGQPTWEIVTTTPGSGSGPQEPFNGNFFLQSANNTNHDTFDKHIVSPPIILPSTYDLQLSFNYFFHAGGGVISPGVNALRIDISTDNGNSWETLNQISNVINPTFWVFKSLPLSRYRGNCIKIRFTNINHPRQPGHKSIDHIQITRLNSSKTQLSQKDNISLHPNPVNNQLHVTIPNSATKNQYSYKITNVSGSEILRGTSEQNTRGIDVSQLPRGIYFITIINDTIAFTKKFVKA